MITEKIPTKDIIVPNPLHPDKFIKNFFMVYKDEDQRYKIFMQAGESVNQIDLLFSGLSSIADILIDQEDFEMPAALGVKIRDCITDFAKTLDGFKEYLEEGQ